MAYIFAILIGFFMAVMDRTLEPVHFNTSIFAKLDQKWWVRSVSWAHVSFLPGTRYRPDAWHIAKSLLILSIGGLGAASSKICLLQNPFLNVAVIAIIWGSVITASFVLFYDYILKAETWQKKKSSRITKSSP